MPAQSVMTQLKCTVPGPREGSLRDSEVGGGAVPGAHDDVGTGCGVDQGHCHPGFALEPMELRPDTSHKENVPPRPATPLRPGKRLRGSGSEVAGARSPRVAAQRPFPRQASPGPC
ncbi:hypothetical protein J1605_000793 [Eschrichtius robustus]|uniref:Uncharacterized protein n=1 Tax=Eschrichtius robustus TaxID=9764 RepID=A0AB34GQL3_ESCRO|nr:hypothetical protein J1605_000793 [Eschrichtius robustus]